MSALRIEPTRCVPHAVLTPFHPPPTASPVPTYILNYEKAWGHASTEEDVKPTAAKKYPAEIVCEDHDIDEASAAESDSRPKRPLSLPFPQLSSSSGRPQSPAWLVDQLDNPETLYLPENSVETSAHNLLPPLTLLSSAAAVSDPIPFPAFLRSRRAAQLDFKWTSLDSFEMNRLRHGKFVSDNDDESHPWARYSDHVRALRNRYKDVESYQAHRMHLKVSDGVFDYINASHITLRTQNGTQLRYIATQAPNADNWLHFWRMLWHEMTSPAVVVMIANDYELGRNGGHQYFPRSLTAPILRVNERDELGDGFIHDLHLIELDSDQAARTAVREMELTALGTDQTSHNIWHLLFEGWHEFSVPEDGGMPALLNLIDLSHRKSGETSPLIVHCSAGLGRTGTFIALDWLVHQLREGALDFLPADEDPVAQVIKQLRDQLPIMVQSKQQFIFLYDILGELWRERWIY